MRSVEIISATAAWAYHDYNRHKIEDLERLGELHLRLQINSMTIWAEAKGVRKKQCHTSVINCLSPIGIKALACQHTLLYRIRVKWIGWQQSTHGKVCTQHTLVSLLTRCMGIWNLFRPKFPWRYPSKVPCQPISVTNSRSVLVKNFMGTLESFFCADKRQYRDMDNYPWCVCWSNGLYILQNINKPGRLATVILVDCVGFCVDKRLGERVLANM